MLKIRELREEKHLTQIEMALNLGVSRQVYANWENEINQPELKMIIILADFFGVTTDYLLGRTDDLGAVTSVPVFPQFSEEDREVLSLFLDARISSRRAQNLAFLGGRPRNRCLEKEGVIW